MRCRTTLKKASRPGSFRISPNRSRLRSSWMSWTRHWKRPTKSIGGAPNQQVMISSSDILNAKILIVDDQQANVLLLERMLHGAGYASITSTTDPRQVCDLHRQNRYD